jgi:hypothetical protein
MKYTINEWVLVTQTNEIKKVVDSELILDKEIYYMEDKSCFESSQLTIIEKNEVMDRLINKNVHNLVDYFSNRQDFTKCVQEYLRCL